MKKLFTLLTLALLSIGTAWAQTDVTASWLPESSSMNLTGSTTNAAGLTVSSGVMSSAVKSVSTWSKNNHYYYVVDRNDKTQDTKGTINENRYIDFVATVSAGVSFTLNTAQVVGIGAGTGNNSFRVDVIDDEGSTTIRNAGTVASGTDDAVNHTFVSPKTYAEGKTIKIRIYIGINNTSDDKNVGFRDVQLIGTYEANDAPNCAPSFTTNLPISDNANVDIEKSLSVVVTGKPAPTYQWYSCTDAEKAGAAAIDGATTNTYTFTPAAAGTYYYYVVATNSEGSATSNVVTLTVTAVPPADPTFTVYGNTVQISCATDDATIYYELDNADIKSSATRSTYSGTFIPASSGTIYAYSEKAGLQSEVVSKAVMLSTVGDVVGGIIATVQPSSQSDETTTFNNITISSGGTLEASGRGVYVNHFKGSGTITLTAANGQKIQSIKICGTSNDGSKPSTITAGSGATVVSSPAELMPRDVTVGGVQTMTEIVLTVDEPTVNNSISFTLGRESRFYVEVYGEGNISITPAKTYTTLTSAYSLNFTDVSGLKAYIATEVSEGNVQMTQVNKVPAGTGLVLKAMTPGDPVSVPVFDGAGADDVSLNKMQGSAIETTVVAENGGYILKDGVFQPATDGSLPVGKAYLNIAVSAPVLMLNFGDVTGINEVQGSGFKANGYYDLQGRKVAQPSKGLYIVNGKKVVIK